MKVKDARFFAVFFLVVCAAGAVFAQVDQGELEKNLHPVTFINYEGPHSRVETREQIRNIGVELGRSIKAGNVRAGDASRYFVIHSVSPADGAKIDADIFGLGVDSGVDHIRNLRIIIQGYLQEAYGYSERDAALLAEYVTVYNAVYRGDWDYFSGRYKNQVVENLTREKAGISIRFDEWPARTLMLIPLGMGGLSSIDTSSIADDRVIEEMRREDDKSVEQRRDMVDLKEREAAEAEQRAAGQREAIREEENRIQREREEAERARLEAERERDQVKQDEESGAISSEEARQREEELDQREEEAAEKSEELDQREQALEEQREEAQKQEEFAEQKTEEAQQERESIAEDQQAVISEEERQARGVIGANIEKADTSLGRLIRLDPANSEELKRSPLNTVNIRTLIFPNGKIIAIAGENTGNGAIRLIEINNANLEMAKQGEDDIHPNSILWVNGNDLYALTVNLADGKIYLGRFDTNLTLQAKSAIEIHPNTSVSIQKETLLTQRADGSPVLLNPADLTELNK